MTTKVLKELRNTVFPVCRSRSNVSDKNQINHSFVLGDVNYRGQKKLKGLTRGPSRHNNSNSTLLELLKSMIHSHDPEFEYTTIQLNKNVQCDPHVDKNNMGYSYIIALGDYIGGELNLEGNLINIRDRMIRFDGTKGHWTEPFEGERYSVVFFTHTFKPPNPSLRNIIVTRNGIFKKEVLLKSYKKPLRRSKRIANQRSK